MRTNFLLQKIPILVIVETSKSHIVLDVNCGFDITPHGMDLPFSYVRGELSLLDVVEFV